jgi:pyrroloquinoline quinone biosynthesis protein B
LIDCTPAFARQWSRLNTVSPAEWGLTGILLSHAHIGHYTGLMQLGREAWSTSELPVYVMPRMKTFLEMNAPWRHLIENSNITLREMQNGVPVNLSENIQVTPILVPHRDEYSETVGFRIISPDYNALYISDIDHWNSDELNIEAQIKISDVAWLDGTFYSKLELPHRNRENIPHPTIKESLKRFSALPNKDRKKIHFFHLNHSNPITDNNSPEALLVKQSGFQIANEMSVWPPEKT